MIQKAGIPGVNNDSGRVRKEISYWESQNKKRKCTEFSEMSYWEVVSNSNAL
ncbi:hypothetical protein [Aquimarina muelleri]|uniref:Uncharacterized protein n=1 Tax=Aquimarina muelleri TaxID=279356 RepID=A0A918JX13_9FLAO|nr:hypothetical protein [Aquimarina muelleri]MCX2763854.1 hypothetical protein [Aquimarina muelleri]GGX29291.1 hypothetical protein GCM10007384_33090 [Aquimarina muelleri]